MTFVLMNDGRLVTIMIHQKFDIRYNIVSLKLVTFWMQGRICVFFASYNTRFQWIPARVSHASNTLLERVLFLISELICSLSRALIVVVVVFIFSSTNLCCTILLSMVRYVESILSRRTKYLVRREKIQNTVVMGA